MSFMSWTVLVFLLSTTGTLDAVDQDWLTRVVEIIRTEYSYKNQICIAVNVPEDVNPDDLLTYLENDRWQGKVENVTSREEVYTGQRVVAASYNKNEQAHAETRVLEAMKNWEVDTQGNFLIFYTYLSPCAIRCASKRHEENISKALSETLPPWGGRSALVFARPCTRIGQNTILREKIETSLLNLKQSGFNANIFRCYKPSNANFQCVQCFSGSNANRAADQCVVESEGEGGPSQGPSCSSGQTETDIDIGSNRSGSGGTGRSRSGSGSTGRSSSGSGSRSRSRNGSGSTGRSRSGSGSTGRSRTSSGSRSRSHSGSASRSRGRSGSASRSRSRSGSGRRSRSRSGSGRRSRSRSGSSSRSRSRSGSGSRSRSRSGRGSRSRSSGRRSGSKRRRFGAL